MSIDYLLHESSVGYAIFKVVIQADSVGIRLKEVQERAQNIALFGKTVELVSFAPFQGAAQALENANKIADGVVSDYLKALLEANLPKTTKKKKAVLGVSDKGLAGNIRQAFPYVDCETSETSEVVAELLRGLRLHAQKLLKGLHTGDVERAQLGLGHAYSRAKVKFNVKKNDNHIIQAISTLDFLDKSVNSFSMRVREWYSWHFPELLRIVSENHSYLRLVVLIGDKTLLSDKSVEVLAAVVNDDEAIAKAIIEAARVSMGRTLSEGDMESVISFARRALRLAEVRKSLQIYLASKMKIVAPNLSTLIGDTVGARLISHAGSLTNLAKYAASTLQILGAEKALFRALKTKSNTPKYGLIYHSSFIGRAGMRNKGRISRFLANKCSIASRIDNFTDAPSTKFGEALKQQVEDRLEFYNSGRVPSKNEQVMKSAMDAVLGNIDVKASLGDDLDEDADVDMADPAPKESTSGSGVAANGDTSRPNGVAGDVGAQPEQGKEGKKGKKEKRKRASETATHEAASKSHKAKAKTDRHGNATTVDIRLKKKKKEAREE